METKFLVENFSKKTNTIVLFGAKNHRNLEIILFLRPNKQT